MYLCHYLLTVSKSHKKKKKSRFELTWWTINNVYYLPQVTHSLSIIYIFFISWVSLLHNNVLSENLMLLANKSFFFSGQYIAHTQMEVVALRQIIQTFCRQTKAVFDLCFLTTNSCSQHTSWCSSWNRPFQISRTWPCKFIYRH